MSFLGKNAKMPDKPAKSRRAEDDAELLVFGYGCKLFRDDAKAILENSGQLLIPWMGDSSLMVDRYDVRSKLEDKRLFGLKPNLSRPISAEEREMEEVLNKERYLALECDDIRVEEQEEEERKRKNENAFNAVSFTYGDTSEPKSAGDTEPVMDSNLSLPEHPPTSSVDTGEDDKFIPPPGLCLPEGLQTPSTNKLHSIIEKTASFISKQGTQMEIIIKTKQKFNPYFSFLNYKDELFPYYTHLKDMIRTGGYQPKLQQELNIHGPSRGRNNNLEVAGTAVRGDVLAAGREGSPVKINNAVTISSDTKDSKESTEKSGSESDSDSGSDSDDEGYLHPLLMKASLKASKPSTPEPAPPPPETKPKAASVSLSNKKLSMDELLNLRSSSFMARSKNINSAPPFVATQGQPTSAYSEADMLSSYELYRQQYYGSSPAIGSGQDAGYHGYLPDGGAPLPPPHDVHATNGATSQGNPYLDHGYFAHFSQPVPPPELRPVVDKTAEYVAKNSDDFERTVLERHIGDTRFSFLNPWDQFHPYYQFMKQHNRTQLEQGDTPTLPIRPLFEEEASERPNLQKLSSSGAVSFKLQNKQNSSSAVLPATCSEFGTEESEEGEMEAGEGEGGGEEPPPAKKQRVENDGRTEDDDIGLTVQAFLDTVKGMREPSPAQEPEEDMGDTVQAFLSTVKGMFGANATE